MFNKLTCEVYWILFGVLVLCRCLAIIACTSCLCRSARHLHHYGTSSIFSPSHPVSPQLIASSGPLDLCPPPRCTGTVVQPYTAMPCLWVLARYRVKVALRHTYIILPSVTSHYQRTSTRPSLARQRCLSLKKKKRNERKISISRP